jgi:aminoglycoside phosphotransferase (APT) family kinase protein
VQLLLENDLIDKSRLVYTQLSIQPASQRNHNYFIQCDGGPAYFVKQGVSEATRTTVSREAAFYQRMAASRSHFQRFIPEFVRFLPESCVLVLQLVAGATTLDNFRRSRPRFFSRLGKAMALLHLQPNVPGTAHSDGRPPLISRLGSLSAKDLSIISAGGLELIQTIQQFPEYESALSEPVPETHDGCLTHNDFRSANCLIGPGQVPIIIDWEFAAVGDPAWDVGCVLAEFLVSWLLSMPLGSQIGVERLPMIAAQPLEALRPAIRAFWQGYAAKRGLGRLRAIEFLVRATKFTGFKLAHRAYEMCQFAALLSAVEVCLLQLSWNVLTRPEEAIVRLFGIALDGEPGNASTSLKV